MDRIDRNFYLKQLIEMRDNGRVKVITGIRRCGKSVLLFDIFGDYLRAEGVADDQMVIPALCRKCGSRGSSPVASWSGRRGRCVLADVAE